MVSCSTLVEFYISTMKVVGNMTDVIKDLSTATFCVPLVEKHSPIAYSIINEVHWFDPIPKHSGVETVHRQVLRKAFVMEARDLIKKFRKGCERCRYLTKRTIDVAMGPISTHNMTIAPAFYITQVDLAGYFKSYSPHNKRATVKVWFAVFCCATTSSVCIKVMDDYSSSAFIQCFIRFSCDVGYPKMILCDEGSQRLQDIQLSFLDLKNVLHRNHDVDFEMCPVGGHNFHGKVERKICEIRSSMEKNMHYERLSILQWETLAAEVANTINDLPLALGNVCGEFENMDLITPNRLRLGRNNNRSPVDPLNVTSSPAKFFKDNQRIFQSWFESWLISYVPNLMNHPKWFSSSRNTKPGDVVLFLKRDGVLASTYQYGMVKDVHTSSDGRIRKVVVTYRNHHEKFDRVTNRAVRELVLIHPVDELNIIQELGESK